MKKGIEIPETNDKFFNIAKEYISSNNEIKIAKTLKFIQKLCKKENDYIMSRDLVVMGCVFIGSFAETIEDVKTTTNGRETLQKIYDLIYESEVKE